MKHKMTEGQILLTDAGTFVIRNGYPVKEETPIGQFGGKIVRACTVKESPGKEVVIVGRVHDFQPNNRMVKIRVPKDRQGTPGENEQAILLDSNTLVEIESTTNLSAVKEALSILQEYETTSEDYCDLIADFDASDCIKIEKAIHILRGALL